MTDVQDTTMRRMLIPGSHRVIRMLDAQEGPFVGALVTQGGENLVLVSEERLSGWKGWDLAGCEHVAAPVDLVRREDGHDVLLPWCTERVGVFLARRTATSEPLVPGECTTLVASLLRGLGELAGDVCETPGTWWLTEAGRPVFVIGVGADARVGAAELIDVLAGACSDRAMRRMLTAIGDGIRAVTDQPRVPVRLIERWEQELCEIAAPRSLRRPSFGPERARDVARSAGAAADGSTRQRWRSSEGGARARSTGTRTAWSEVILTRAARVSERWMRVRAAIARHASMRPGVAQATAADAAGYGPTARAVPARRRVRTLAVAGAAAAAVLAVGLLWPNGTDADAADGAHERTMVPSPAASSDASAPPHAATTTAAEKPVEDSVGEGGAEGGGAEDGADASSDPLAGARRVARAVRVCVDRGAETCAEAVAPENDAAYQTLRVAITSDVTFAAVDEYGDVAVVRMTNPAETHDGGGAVDEHMLVLVWVEDEWLVRDVYDVADQPE